jgi:hypothetical protein
VTPLIERTALVAARAAPSVRPAPVEGAFLRATFRFDPDAFLVGRRLRVPMVFFEDGLDFLPRAGFFVLPFFAEDDFLEGDFRLTMVLSPVVATQLL